MCIHITHTCIYVYRICTFFHTSCFVYYVNVIIVAVVSQILTITRSTDHIVICEQESVEFSCTTQSSFVQWVAEPIINLTTQVILNNQSNMDPTFRFPNALVQRSSTNPFVTTMTIMGRERRNVTVTCLNLDQRGNASIYYVSGGK